MAESGLAKKLKLTGKKRAAVLGAPAGYFASLRAAAAEKLDGKFDWIQMFVRSQAELDRGIDEVVEALEPESILWISFPKRSSKIQTDLTRDKGWDPLERHELKWITLVSVDETWSAFGVRPSREGEARQDWR